MGMTKVIKHSGHVVNFDPNKLRNSLLRTGADKSLVDSIIRSIEGSIYNGMPTKAIYKHAFAQLKKAAGAHAARYNLRAALQMLGPAGFFFEKFVARLYAAEGYDTMTNLTLQGKCVSHEIDVAIRKQGRIGMIECKFHNSKEANSDIKVPMYILSRFNDIKDSKHTIFTAGDVVNYCIIATNNRFSADAVTFANCSGLQLLSWDLPAGNAIRERIDRKKLYPVTCLTTLSMAEKEKLLILDILLVKELINNTKSLAKIGLGDNRIKNVLKEASELCNYL